MLLGDLSLIPLSSTRFAEQLILLHLFFTTMLVSTLTKMFSRTKGGSFTEIPSFSWSWNILAFAIHTRWKATWETGVFNFWAPPDTFLQKWSHALSTECETSDEDIRWPFQGAVLASGANFSKVTVCPAAERRGWSLNALPSGEEWAGFLEHSSALQPLC